MTRSKSTPVRRLPSAGELRRLAAKNAAKEREKAALVFESCGNCREKFIRWRGTETCGRCNMSMCDLCSAEDCTSAAWCNNKVGPCCFDDGGQCADCYRCDACNLALTVRDISESGDTCTSHDKLLCRDCVIVCCHCEEVMCSVCIDTASALETCCGEVYCLSCATRNKCESCGDLVCGMCRNCSCSSDSSSSSSSSDESGSDPEVVVISASGA